MSKVTLESLRADFGAARNEYDDYRASIWPKLDAELYRLNEVRRFKGKLLHVAEKDGFEAAMLWKLAN